MVYYNIYHVRLCVVALAVSDEAKLGEWAGGVAVRVGRVDTKRRMDARRVTPIPSRPARVRHHTFIIHTLSSPIDI